MKSAYPDAFRAKAHQGIHPFSHLSCCLVRKRDRQDIPRIHIPLFDQICDPVRQYPGLSRTCTRQDQQRSICMIYRLSLGFVQFIINTHKTALLSTDYASAYPSFVSSIIEHTFLIVKSMLFLISSRSFCYCSSALF